MPYRKLIETEMPVSKINAAAEKEKTGKSRMPSIHIWWTRTPLAINRSILFASLVDDPAEHPEKFTTKEEQDRERDRLLQIAGQLAEPESTNNAELLESARKEIDRDTGGLAPIVFDPFVGGGSAPVEAHRLGLDSISSDVNAVATLITTVASDIPTRFSGTVPVHPNEEMVLPIPLPNAEGLAEDVRYYGELILGRTYKKIGHLYPRITNPETGEDADAFAWIWARTIKCPSPSCGCDIPLFPSYELTKKKGSEAWVAPHAENGRIRFKIHYGEHNGHIKTSKVAQTAVFRCPSCGEITPDAYVKECGINHKIESQMIAVIVDHERKRSFLEATSVQEDAARVERPKGIPHGDLPRFATRFSPPLFGLCDYADLFTDRQLVFITTMIQMAKDVQAEIEHAAKESGFADDGVSFADGGNGSLAYAEAVRLALMLTISKYIERCSNLCSWNNSSGGAIRTVYSRRAMAMIWEYAEANPFFGSSDFTHTLSRTCDAIAKLPTGGKGRTYIADGTRPNDVRDAFLLMDLPYYDRVPYQELSDFFYIWLKYGLDDLYPEYFKETITSKKDDMTSFPYRYNGNKQHADAIYVESMKSAFLNLYMSATDKCPSVAGFVYKGYDSQGKEELTGWEQFVTALCEAGFTVTASWPLGIVPEKETTMNGGRGVPVFVVFRKKDPCAPQITRRTFVSAVKRELPELLKELTKKIEESLLRPSVIGKALNIYTRNRQVLDADGSVMKPHTASRIIEQEIDTLLPIYCQSK